MSAISDMLATRDLCEAIGLRDAFIDNVKSWENPFNAYTQHEQFSSWRNGFSVLENINNDADEEITEIEDIELSAISEAAHQREYAEIEINQERDDAIEQILSRLEGYP